MSEEHPKPAKSASQVAELAFRHHLASLHAFLARRMRGGAGMPEDLAMEVFERLLRAKRPDAIENPRAYLFRLASHAIGDQLRLEARTPLDYDSEVVDHAAQSIDLSTADDAGEQIDNERQMASLEQAIAKLPRMHQIVLLLAVRDGVSHKEIARRTGLTVATVGVYACEARARLRTLMSEGTE